MHATTTVSALRVLPDAVEILDQRALPQQQLWLTLRDVEGVAHAIQTLAVRGAPLIGAAAAYGLWLGARSSHGKDLAPAYEQLARSRPTAVNLVAALDRCMAAVKHAPPDTVPELLRQTADAIVLDDAAACSAMARNGAPLLPDEGGVLTHCNAGALATCGIGTALGVIRQAVAMGKKLTVYADETRPLLQGARLTAWELMQDGIEVILLPDGAAAHLIACGRVRAAITGADRVARNGDAANKIGTYGVALACAAHDIPLFIAAPMTTLDAATDNGAGIVIEERHPAEVLGTHGTPGARVFNPAFDVTPARLIRALITERGVASPVTTESVAQLQNRPMAFSRS